MPSIMLTQAITLALWSTAVPWSCYLWKGPVSVERKNWGCCLPCWLRGTWPDLTKLEPYKAKTMTSSPSSAWHKPCLCFEMKVEWPALQYPTVHNYSSLEIVPISAICPPAIYMWESITLPPRLGSHAPSWPSLPAGWPSRIVLATGWPWLPVITVTSVLKFPLFF